MNEILNPITNNEIIYYTLTLCNLRKLHSVCEHI